MNLIRCWEEKLDQEFKDIEAELSNKMNRNQRKDYSSGQLLSKYSIIIKHNYHPIGSNQKMKTLYSKFCPMSKRISLVSYLR